MVNIYDKANELADLLKQSEEYKAYQQKKDAAYADAANQKMIDDFKKLQFEAQATYLAGQEPAAELMDKIKKTGEVLQFNPVITELFAAEYRLNTLVSDLYKIVFGGVADMNMEE